MAIISGCDASPVFQLAEHALDDIAAALFLATKVLKLALRLERASLGG